MSYEGYVRPAHPIYDSRLSIYRSYEIVVNQHILSRESWIVTV